MAKTILLAEASAAQLREFASVHLGLDVAPTMNSNTLRALISQAGYTKDSFEIEEPEAPVVLDAKRASSLAGDNRRVKIVIHTQEEPGGDRPVFVSVNGSAMLIPRGQEVEIPYPYFEALKHAEKIIYDQSPDPRGGLLPPRFAPQYPYTIVSLGEVA